MEFVDGDPPALRDLYDLLDNLIALHIQYADGSAATKRAIAALGDAKIEAVRALLDATIANLKLIIDECRDEICVPQPNGSRGTGASA
jgi:hypothetical protein